MVAFQYFPDGFGELTALGSAKLNFAWLIVETESLKTPVDKAVLKTIRLDFAKGDPVIEAAATLSPTDFAHYLVGVGCDDWALTEAWPSGYIQTMFKRAREAEARIESSLGNNVRLFSRAVRRRAA